MLSIDEAIAFCIEKSNNIKLKAEPEVFIQLAEWLEELKSYRASVFSGYMTHKMLKEEYNKAIDGFVKEICKMIVQSENNGNYIFYAVEIKQAIADLAEQLKAGESE